jgi:hypothetical protein
MEQPDETPETTKLHNEFNTYASHKTIAGQTLNLALITYYVNVMYNTVVNHEANLAYSAGEIAKLIIISCAFLNQGFCTMVNFILLRRKRDETGRTCKCKSTTLNDMVMILGFVTTILNIVIERLG